MTANFINRLLINLDKFLDKELKGKIDDGPILEVLKPIMAMKDGSVLQIALVTSEDELINLQKNLLVMPLKSLCKNTLGLKIELYNFMGPEETEDFEKDDAFTQVTAIWEKNGTWVKEAGDLIRSKDASEALKEEAKRKLQLFKKEMLAPLQPFREKSFSSFPGSEEFPLSSFQCVLVASKNIAEQS